MIDPITQYILNEQMDHREEVYFESKIRSVFRYAQGLPGGKQLKAKFKQNKMFCDKKEDQLEKQGKKDEAFKYGWRCYTAALCNYDNTAISIIRKHAPKFCSKYDGDKKIVCMEVIKFTINNHKYECDTQKRDMKVELGGS